MLLVGALEVGWPRSDHIVFVWDTTELAVAVFGSVVTEWCTDRGWTGERVYLTDYIRDLGRTPAADQSLINLVTVVRP